MASLTDRQKARERLRAAFEAELNKLIPADESLPLHGGKFIEWEDQADELEQTGVHHVPGGTLGVGGFGAGRLRRRALPSLLFDAGVPDQAGAAGGGADGAWAGGAAQAALPLPVLRPVFFPLKSGTGRCRTKRP